MPRRSSRCARSSGSFERFLWQFVDGRPLRGPGNRKAVAASERMSRELKRRGFRFVGPTICYAFMQAVGMVDDHAVDCFRRGRGERGSGARGPSA